MKMILLLAICLSAALTAGLPRSSYAEIVTFEFDVCGAPNTRVPGWVPNGDPNVNGKVTLTIDAERGRMSVIPSDELVQSIRYTTLHAHLYDAKHRYATSEKGQSTICWAYYNTTGRGGTCDPDDYDCQSLTGVKNWPWQEYGYAVNFYRDYLKQVAAEGGEGWYLMLHFAGGHFATDDAGGLIEWDGSPFMEASFEGLNSIRPDCNARIGRRLNDRDFGTADTCNPMMHGVLADDFFLDANGHRWVDEEGNLTPEAIAQGYDLETEYLFFNYRDNGQSDRWGGPDGGAGGFLTGDVEGRCVNWPPLGYASLPAD
ncbi:MAG: hypothetical protein AAGC81_03335 [Pseudomonadota bacterium]